MIQRAKEKAHPAAAAVVWNINKNEKIYRPLWKEEKKGLEKCHCCDRNTYEKRKVFSSSSSSVRPPEKFFTAHKWLSPPK